MEQHWDHYHEGGEKGQEIEDHVELQGPLQLHWLHFQHFVSLVNLGELVLICQWSLTPTGNISYSMSNWLGLGPATQVSGRCSAMICNYID